MMSKLAIVTIALMVAVVNADVYMQYPRGSNNRLNEANRDRYTRVPSFPPRPFLPSRLPAFCSQPRPHVRILCGVQ